MRETKLARYAEIAASASTITTTVADIHDALVGTMCVCDSQRTSAARIGAIYNVPGTLTLGYSRTVIEV